MTFPQNIFTILLIVFSACQVQAKTYDGLELSARDISTLATMKVTPEYVRDMRSHFENLSAKELVDLYVMKVKPNYLHDMRALVPDLSVREVVDLSVMKVSPEYVRDMRALVPDLSVREVVDLSVMKVKPDYIKQMREAGQPVVAGHVPQIDVHVPKINVHVSPAPVVSPIHSAMHLSPIKTHSQIAGDVAIGFALIVFTGFVVYVLRQKLSERRTDENLNSRITDFEQRVNDLQDVLLSIDDRLDRKLGRI